MADDNALTLRQADSLYQGFPDFSDWPAPTEDALRLWDRFAFRLREMRGKATPEVLRRSVEVAVRAAAMDTGAIEGLYTVDRGFTMTVATQAFAWEHAIEEKGENVRTLFEAQLAAYELVIDAVTQKLPITEAWIRALHEKVCAGQRIYRVQTDQGWQEQELPRGAYKTYPNHVRLADGAIHPYAPVDRVSSEMHRLLAQIRTLEFEYAHPIAQASYLHYGFVVIHPFADGNGRVARALASVYFYRALSIPFLVFANQRTAYFDALHEADLGQARPLLAFFRDRGIDTIQLVVDHLRTAEAPSPEMIALNLKSPSKASTWLPPQEMDDTAIRLLAAIGEQMSHEVEKLELPDHLKFFIDLSTNPEPAPSGYRQVDESTLRAALWDKSQGKTTQIQIRVLASLDETNPFAFLVEIRPSDDILEVRLEDARPEISETLWLRIANWNRRHLGHLLEKAARRSSARG